MSPIRTHFKTITGRLAVAWRTLLAAALLLTAPVVHADVGPPVEIKMALDAPAISGVEYSGTFLVNVFRAGVLSDFRIEGEGWTVRSADFSALQENSAAGVRTVPFRAVPGDADKPIALSLRYNRRPVRQQYEIGPAYFAQRGKRGALQRVDAGLTPMPPAARAAPGGGGAGPRGPIPLHILGRLVYTREDGRVVGADSIPVRVCDDDDLAFEDIWVGLTDEHGYFDTGWVQWDDCDAVGCDTPDLVVLFEAYREGWVDVTHNTVGEETYAWETEEVTNFEGAEYDFGPLTPTIVEQRPALHIYNGIIRARRFILEKPGIGTPEVQIEWPDDSRGANAWYEDDSNEIHLSSNHTWKDDTHTHEYGHHYIDSEYATDPPPPNYDNEFCDENDPQGGCGAPHAPGDGHCVSCRETDHDAFNEGFPNWLADVVLRDYALRYTFDRTGGEAYTALYSRDQEWTFPCCQDGMLHDPLLTEIFVGALLRDIEDGTYDDHDDDPDPNEFVVDGIRDLLCVGPNPIFHAVRTHEPITVLQFISAFRTEFPQLDAELFATAFNVGGPAYVAGFPGDSQPPGLVPSCNSPSHPLGAGGPLPCMTFEFDPAPDDATGACSYSYEFTSDPAGLEPDENADPIGWSESCKLVARRAALGVGNYYFSIKAQDGDGNWSTQWRTFGPFTVTDCNGSGLLDLCDIECPSEGIPGVCELSLCVFGPGVDCGLSSDCNGNYVPDECDIANGQSEDCNQNGIPDECETANLKHWTGNDGMHPTWWELGANWAEGAAPNAGNDACILSGEPTPLLRRDTFTLGTLACYQDFQVAQAAGFALARLNLTEPSFILGNLNMTSGRFDVADELVISGTLDWSGGMISGAGQTTVTGAHRVNGTVALQFHTLNLQCDTLVTSGGFGGGGNSNFVIRNFPGYTYTQAEGIVHQANSSVFINEGTFLKPSGSGVTRLDSPVNNSGEMRTNQGTLRFGTGLVSTGSILGLPGTTLEFSGSQDFAVGSNLVGDSIVFQASAAPNSRHIRGAYDAGTSTSIITGASVTWHDTADVVDYGAHLEIDGGTGHFEAITGAPIVFETVNLHGTAYFDSGDPIIVNGTFDLGPGNGTLRGASQDITINGLFTWKEAADIIDPGNIHANGGIRLEFSAGSRNLPRFIHNAATTTMLGSLEVNAGGGVNNLVTGTWDIQVDGSITGSALVFNNAGTLVKSAGAGTATLGSGNPANRPTITNTGTVEVRSGTLRFSWGSFTQTAGQTVLNGGNLTMFGSPAMPLQLNGGSLRGSGTVTAVVNNAGAAVEPGLSAGTLNITGAYTQSAGGAYRVEIGGTGAGQFDVLNVSGAATLAGELNVQTINGYVPSTGDSFVILTAGSRSGTFASVTGAPGFEVSYTPTQVILTATTPQLPGDVDGDCDVDLSDLLTLLSNFGSTTGEMGDLDSDGDVDLADLAALLSHFGTTC